MFSKQTAPKDVPPQAGGLGAAWFLFISCMDGVRAAPAPVQSAYLCSQPVTGFLLFLDRLSPVGKRPDASPVPHRAPGGRQGRIAGTAVL